MKPALYLFLILLTPFSAIAQNCTITPEAIVKLRAPEIGAFNIWDAEYGEPQYEESFKQAFVKENGNVIVAGERYANGDKKITLILSEYDRRGRSIWHTEHKVKSLQDIVKIMSLKDGFAVIGNKNDGARAGAAWVGIFNGNGKLKSQHSIRIPKIQLRARDIAPAPDGKGYIMAASGRETKAGATFYALFIRLNKQLQFVSKRSYQPGPENEILALTPHENALIASGYIKGTHNREIGWILRLENNGSIAWQKQYSRGRGARLMHNMPHQNGRTLVVGEAIPANQNDFNAGWVMLVDADDGGVIWQRYFTGNRYKYLARDALVSNDGMISVLLDAEKPGTNAKDHDIIKDQAGRALGNRTDYVRLITLNPRGVMFDSMHFFHGEGADAFDMKQGKTRERIVIGASDIRIEDDGNIQQSADGWIIAASPMDRYEDPCQ